MTEKLANENARDGNARRENLQQECATSFVNASSKQHSAQGSSQSGDEDQERIN